MISLPWEKNQVEIVLELLVILDHPHNLYLPAVLLKNGSLYQPEHISVCVHAHTHKHTCYRLYFYLISLKTFLTETLLPLQWFFIAVLSCSV